MSDEAGRNREEAASGGGATAHAAGTQKDGDRREPQVRLRRLRVQKWRNVLPGTDLRFGEGIHALLGKNGSGKTTLLRLISMCVRSHFAEMKSEPFDIEYDLEHESQVLTVVAVHRPGESVELDAPLVGGAGAEATHEPLKGFGVHVTFWRGGRPRPTADGSHAGASRKERRFRASPIAEPVLQELRLAYGRPEEAAFLVTGDPDYEDVLTSLEHATSYHFAGGNAGLYRFDEGTGVLEALEGPGHLEAVMGGWDAMQGEIPPFSMLLRSGSLPFPIFDSPWASIGLISALRRRHPLQLEDLAEIRVTDRELRSLKRFTELAGFAGAELRISLVERVKLLTDEREHCLFGSCKFFITLGNGDILPHDELSFGQRRLLSFLYYAACNWDVLIVDDLTSGMHPEWIPACVEELVKRQSFVATQDPLLLDHLPIKTSEDIETAFIQCRLVEKDGKEWMHFRNTSPEEASRFLESYESGVQYVSEILRTEGLW